MTAQSHNIPLKQGVNENQERLWKNLGCAPFSMALR